MTTNTKTPIVKNCGDKLQNDFLTPSMPWCMLHMLQDIYHFTPPHQTQSEGSCKATQLLFDHGVDVNIAENIE